MGGVSGSDAGFRARATMAPGRRSESGIVVWLGAARLDGVSRGCVAGRHLCGGIHHLAVAIDALRLSGLDHGEEYTDSGARSGVIGSCSVLVSPGLEADRRHHYDFVP